MKIIRNAIISVVVLGLLLFTFFFVLDAYNKGTIGNKAEKVADTFTQDIIGTWQGEYSISKITFKEEGVVSLTIFGAVLNGEYEDNYDLEKEQHTLRIKYNTAFGVSVESYYLAELEGNTLSLIDTRLDSMKMIYTKVSSDNSQGDSNQKSTTVYNPGIDKVKKDILGKWNSDKSTSSGFEFKEDYSVSLRILGVSYDGRYSISVDDTTGRCVLKIDYISVGNVSVSNSYYMSIENDTMTLNQVGLENVSTIYNKAEF